MDVTDLTTMNMVTHSRNVAKQRTAKYSEAMNYVFNYIQGNSAPHFPVPALNEHDPALFSPQKLVDFRSIQSAGVSYAGY